MAVAAIAAGAVGGKLALSDASEVSQGVREFGAAVGLAALAYAAFNLEEVSQVARDLSQAEQRLQALRHEQFLAQRLRRGADTLRQAQGRQQVAARRMQMLRTALQAS